LPPTVLCEKVTATSARSAHRSCQSAGPRGVRQVGQPWPDRLRARLDDEPSGRRRAAIGRRSVRTFVLKHWAVPSSQRRDRTAGSWSASTTTSPSEHNKAAAGPREAPPGGTRRSSLRRGPRQATDSPGDGLFDLSNRTLSNRRGRKNLSGDPGPRLTRRPSLAVAIVVTVAQPCNVAQPRARILVVRDGASQCGRGT
jgi:hypothetical protein